MGSHLGQRAPVGSGRPAQPESRQRGPPPQPPSPRLQQQGHLCLLGPLPQQKRLPSALRPSPHPPPPPPRSWPTLLLQRGRRALGPSPLRRRRQLRKRKILRKMGQQSKSS